MQVLTSDLELYPFCSVLAGFLGIPGEGFLYEGFLTLFSPAVTITLEEKGLVCKSYPVMEMMMTACMCVWATQTCPISVAPWTARLLYPWDSPGRNSRMGSLSFLQEIFLTQGLNQVSCTAGRFFTIWATREAQWWWSLTFNECFLSVGFVLTTQHAILLNSHCNPKRSVLYRLHFTEVK